MPLLMAGIIIGLIEKALYQFNILSFYQNNTGALVSAILMFLLAFVSVSRLSFRFSDTSKSILK